MPYNINSMNTLKRTMVRNELHGALVWRKCAESNTVSLK